MADGLLVLALPIAVVDDAGGVKTGGRVECRRHRQDGHVLRAHLLEGGLEGGRHRLERGPHDAGELPVALHVLRPVAALQVVRGRRPLAKGAPEGRRHAQAVELLPVVVREHAGGRGGRRPRQGLQHAFGDLAVVAGLAGGVLDRSMQHPVGKLLNHALLRTLHESAWRLLLGLDGDAVDVCEGLEPPVTALPLLLQGELQARQGRQALLEPVLHLRTGPAPKLEMLAAQLSGLLEQFLVRLEVLAVGAAGRELGERLHHLRGDARAALFGGA
mmetsp:Transcript_117592/g.379532  ORF Transcript_117592/g.379532 Transcript_117592/m.379532 type:complete len:273 (-) Transcript_117592:1391-2209(-)